MVYRAMEEDWDKTKQEYEEEGWEVGEKCPVWKYLHVGELRIGAIEREVVAPKRQRT
jgi:hypothetical protein